MCTLHTAGIAAARHRYVMSTWGILWTPLNILWTPAPPLAIWTVWTPSLTVTITTNIYTTLITNIGGCGSLMRSRWFGVNILHTQTEKHRLIDPLWTDKHTDKHIYKHTNWHTRIVQIQSRIEWIDKQQYSHFTHAARSVVVHSAQCCGAQRTTRICP